MKIQESIRTCFTKYADILGRADRSEFWWFFLFVVVVGGALWSFSEVLGSAFALVTILPAISVTTRRLHDTNRSGWWQLVCLFPIVGVVVLLAFLAQDSQQATVAA